MLYEAEGENLTLFSMVKTSNDLLIDRKVAGAEAAVKPKSSQIVSNFDQVNDLVPLYTNYYLRTALMFLLNILSYLFVQKMNKKSTTRNKDNTGSLTVTASADTLADLVREVGEKTAF